MLKQGWKLFKKYHIKFILSNQEDVSDYLKENYYSVEKIKNIYDEINIKSNIMTAIDHEEYDEESIEKAYMSIYQKESKDEVLRPFERNLYRFILNKFEFYKILKTLYLSVFYTIILTLIALVAGIVLGKLT